MTVRYKDKTRIKIPFPAWLTLQIRVYLMLLLLRVSIKEIRIVETTMKRRDAFALGDW